MWKRENSRVFILVVFAFVLIGLSATEAIASPEFYNVSANPYWIQEGSTTTITLDVTDALGGTLYTFMFYVLDPAGDVYDSFGSYMTAIGETSFSISLAYPTDFSFGAHTDYVGPYLILVDQIDPVFIPLVAVGDFTVGLTDKTAYQRTEQVQIRSSGWAPMESCTVDITIGGSSIPGYPKSVPANSGGVVADAWAIPVDVAMGTYSVTVVGTTTVKPVLDSQVFDVFEAILDIDVWTDKDFYLTDDTILISANVAYPNGTVLTSGTVNVAIVCLWVTVLDPATTMTYNTTSQLWEYRYTLDITDPSAQSPLNWDIYVWVEDDGYGNYGSGYNYVNTLVYVGPGLTYTLTDGRYDEFGSILVDGGTLIVDDSQIVMHPPWHGAHNITERGSGTMMVENSTIYSEWGQWLFWITEDSSAHLNHAKIRDLPPLPEDLPGFLICLGSSLDATNSSIYGVAQVIFSSSVMMEDSMVGMVMLMDGSKGYFDNATMAMLYQTGLSEGTVKNSQISTAIYVDGYSHLSIFNSHIGFVAVYYNSTATISDTLIDYSLSVRYGSSVTASNLTIGYGLYDWVNIYIDQSSGGEFSNTTITGSDISISINDRASASFNTLNCTGYYISIHAWRDVSLSIDNAVINATRYLYSEEIWLWDGMWRPEPPPDGYDGFWGYNIVEEARGGQFSLHFGNNALVSITNIDIVESQFVTISGQNSAELIARNLDATVTGGYVYYSQAYGTNWPVPPGWIEWEWRYSYYAGGEFNLNTHGKISSDIEGLSVQADHIWIEGWGDVEFSSQNIQLLSREGHTGYGYYAAGNSTGIYYYSNDTWWNAGSCGIWFGEGAALNLASWYIEAENIYFNGGSSVVATFEDVYLLTPTTGHFTWQYEERIDYLGVTYEITNYTSYQSSYVDFNFYDGAHIEMINVTISAYDEYYLYFSDGGTLTLSNCRFSSQRIGVLTYTWYYHYLYGSEEIEYRFYEPISELWVSGGFRATITDSTFASYNGNTAFGSGVWSTVTNCSFLYYGNHNFGADSGVTLVMKNVSINSTSGSLNVRYGCDVTLEEFALTSSYGYFVVISDGSVGRFTNCNLDLNATQGGFAATGGVTMIIENSTIRASWMNMTQAVCGRLTGTDFYAPITIDGGSDVTMKNCLLNSTLTSGVSLGSYTTLIGCTVVDDVSVGMGGSLTLDATTLMKTLYVTLGPSVTVKDSTVTIETILPPVPIPIPPQTVQSIQWLHAYDAQITLNGTAFDIWVYNLHNHFNASSIYHIGTVYILQTRWCLSVHAVDDYGVPIPEAFVEIRNSTNHLIHSGYTDLDGVVRIYPKNDAYTITVYANGETATGSATINDMCAEASFELDITTPMINSITQDPATPNYKQNVIITANVSDPSGIASVTLWYHNGTAWYSLPMSHVSGDLYSATIPSEPYGTTIRYYITAVDNSANSASSSEHTYIVIDNLMPEASDFTLNPSPPMYYQNATVSVTLTDPNGVEEAWLVYIIEDTEYWVELTLVTPNRYAATIPKQPYGTIITYHIWAIDGLGNNGNTTPLNYTVGDDVQPTGEIITPSADDYLQGTVNITVTGYDINFDKMELYVDEALTKTWPESGTHFYTLVPEEGSRAIKLVVYDKAGNNASSTVTVTIDNTPPTVGLSEPEEGAELTGTVTIQFTATDDAKLATVLLYIDNAVINVTGKNSYEWDTTTVGDDSHLIKIVAFDEAGNKKETQITVTTKNVEEAKGESYSSGRDLGLVVGLPIGLLVGAAAVYFLTKRRTTPKAAKPLKPTKPLRKDKNSKG